MKPTGEFVSSDLFRTVYRARQVWYRLLLLADKGKFRKGREPWKGNVYIVQ